MTDHLGHTVSNVIDVISFTVLVGALIKFLPAIAALLSIVWSILRIYEGKTVQSWLRRRKAKKRVKRSATNKIQRSND